MQRPRRIVIFGVLSLIVGGLTLLNNLQQLSAAVGGPDAIDVDAASQYTGQVGMMMRNSLIAQQTALAEPVYRVGLGLKSLASAAMACLLAAVGIGLLRHQPWSLRLAKAWAYFAIASALLITALQGVYLVPNTPMAQANSGSASAQYVGIAFIFIVLCVFPLLMLRVLPSQPVRAYLGQQPNANQSAGVQDVLPPLNDLPADQHQPADPGPPVSPSESTWRDDPWNDNTSR